MKYYKHHIGDFDQSTRHLTRIERSIYRDLIEMYYDTEQILPDDIDYLCRKIIARSDEERTSVEQVLNEFFTKVPEGWYHDRCEEEIQTYHNNKSKRSEAGKASAEARKQRKQKALNKRSASVEQTSNKPATNHKPLTTNHKPSKEGESAERGSKSDDPDPPKPIQLKNPGFSARFIEQVWPHYLKVKLGKPYKNRESQEVALRQLYKWSKGSEQEAVEALAYAVANSYQGFQWYFRHKQNGESRDAANTMQDGNPHAIANAAAIQALQRGRVAESPAGVGNRSG